MEYQFSSSSGFRVIRGSAPSQQNVSVSGWPKALQSPSPITAVGPPRILTVFRSAETVVLKKVKDIYV